MLGRRRTLCVACASVALLYLPLPGPARPVAAAGDPLPSFSRHLLPNGLTVLLAEEHSQPLVSVAAWYRVGARNERPGITGIAHYLEHMGFRATQNIAGSDVFGQIERLGGHWHGYTRFDNTVYYETARREALEWLLFLEAERMQRCRILPAEVEVERGSVLSELKGYENDPWSLLFDEVAATAFREHPYGYNISGWVSDIEALTHADLVEFYREHYVPSNVVLAVVGDFETQAALAAVRRQFGSFPRRPQLAPLRTVEPVQRGEKRVTLRMPGSSPSVLVAHKSPPFSDPDYFPFLVLDAILSGGRGVSTLGADFEIGLEAADRRSSRLFRELVATGLASRVTTGLLPTLHPYLYTVTAEAAPGVAADALESAMVACLERLAAEPPGTEELAAARRRLATRARLQADSYQEVAHLLATLEAYGGLELWGKIEERIAAVGASEVQAAARRALRKDNRTVGRFEPASATAATSPAAALAAPAASPAAGPVRVARQVPPSIRLGRAAPLLSPVRRTLPSGLGLAAVENPWVSTAAIVADIEAGPFYDPQGAEGLAVLTARLLAAGSEERSAAQFAEAVDRMGLRWSAEVGGTRLDLPDPRRVRIELEFAVRDFEDAAALLAQSLRAPLFPSDAFRTTRQSLIAEAGALEDDTEGLARSRLTQALYSGTPYGRPALGRNDTLASVGRADAQRFHAVNYLPERVRIAFSGGLPAEQALSALQRVFSGWEPERDTPPSAPVSVATLPEAPTPPEPARLMHKTQVDLAYGFFTGVGAGSTDTPAFAALMYVVQHGFYSGRLGARIVGKEGLAYSVESHHAAELPGAPLLIATGAPPEKVDRLVRLWEATLDEVGRDGITPGEFEAARTFLEGRRLHLRETNLSASRAALEEPIAPAGSAPTLDQVNRLARRIFAGRKAIWSLAGPLPPLPPGGATR